MSVDCGDCPRVSTGCPDGECFRARAAAELLQRPRFYAHTSTLPPGRLDLVELESGWTVARRCGQGVWLPITQRDNPAWKCWPTKLSAAAFLAALGVGAVWPHWGSGARDGR